MKGNTLQLTGIYTKTIFKSWFQYPIDAILRSVAVFLRESTEIIVIYFALLKFDNINGWNMHEMLFLFSLIFLTYGILIIFFTGLRDFHRTVRDGSFDRYILRPRGLLYQLIFSDADWFATIGHGGLGVVLFVVSAGKIGVTWNAGTVIYYILAVFGGVLIQGAIFLVLATLSIYLIETGSIKELFYFNGRKIARYPISIFHPIVQNCVIFVVPFAFVNYFPAQYLLRKEDMALYPEIFMYLTLVVGIVMYLAAYIFWRYSIRYYKSTGN